MWLQHVECTSQVGIGTKLGIKLTTDAQVVPSGGTSLQSQLAAKAALSG